MNCKQGDLAFLVHGRGENLGRICHVDSFCCNADGLGAVWNVTFDRPVSKWNWLTRERMPDARDCHVPDKWLRPIRPDSEPTSFESHRELEHA